MTPTDAVWYNSLKEKIPELNTAGIAMENFDETLSSFHRRVTEPFISQLSANINSRFADCKELLVAFSLIDHRHLPAESDPTYKEYGNDKLVAWVSSIELNQKQMRRWSDQLESGH